MPNVKMRNRNEIRALKDGHASCARSLSNQNVDIVRLFVLFFCVVDHVKYRIKVRF
jgi:hypothetical protein